MRTWLTVSLMGIGAFGVFASQSLGTVAPPSPSPVLVVAPAPDGRGAPEPLEPARFGLELGEPCDDDEAALVIVQELSTSMLEGQQMAPTLPSALGAVRARLPDRVAWGLVGFAQRLWTADGTASTDPHGAAWRTLGHDATLPTLPDRDGEANPLGSCANVALGLEAGIAQLVAAKVPDRALWLVVDGLHDCDVDGRFAYAPLAPWMDRAARAGIDVSVLVVDSGTTRDRPSPLERLARGRGSVTRVEAWELGEGLASLAHELRATDCRR